MKCAEIMVVERVALRKRLLQAMAPLFTPTAFLMYTMICSSHGAHWNENSLFGNWNSDRCPIVYDLYNMRLCHVRHVITQAGAGALVARAFYAH